MGVLDIFKRSIPAAVDPANATQWFTDYSLTDRSPVIVSSEAEAEGIRGQFRAQGGSGVMFAWVTSIQNLLFHPNTGASGEGWQRLSGRDHGFLAHLTGTITAKSPAPLTITHFENVSDGTTVTPDSKGIVIPAEGLWQFHGWITVSGGNVGLSRSFVRVRLNEASLMIGGGNAFDEDGIPYFGGYKMGTGQSISLLGNHQDAAGTRTFSGFMLGAMINSPRWKRTQ